MLIPRFRGMVFLSYSSGIQLQKMYSHPICTIVTCIPVRIEKEMDRFICDQKEFI